VILAPTPAQRPYKPYGAALQVLRERRREVLLSGPAGTGKTRANCEKLYACANKYPGCRILIVRKTRASLSQSVLVTWEEKVVPLGHPCLKGPTREFRKEYRFPNGSVVAVGGLDEPSRILSTEWDIIYVAEAIELTEKDWETLTTRLRNGVIPYQQIIADTNPDSPQHWLYQRQQAGKCLMLESRHEDNPAIFDQQSGQLTERGKPYIEALDQLTGVRKARYRHGRWVAAEGVVYEDWNAAIHRIYLADIPTGWQSWARYWAVDFGYTNPFVWQEWVLSPDGAAYRIREIYKTKTLVEDHAKAILHATGRTMTFDAAGKPTGKLVATRENPDPLPSAIVCDHDAEDRATLSRHLGLTTIGAYKAVSSGIQAVAARLKPTETGRGTKAARLYFVRDGLIHVPDEELLEKRMPVCTEDEMDGYVWDTASGKKVGEEPVKKNDHGADTTRYFVAHVDDVRTSQRKKTTWVVR